MSFIKKLSVIALLCIAFRVSYALGADAALDGYIHNAVNDETTVAGAVISQSPLLMANKESGEPEQMRREEQVETSLLYNRDADNGEADMGYTVTESAIPPNDYGNEVEETQSGGEESNIAEKTITGGEGYMSADGLSVKNNTVYDINIAEILNQEIAVSLQSGAESPQVLIIHTHGSEAYAPNGTYVESDSYRTQDTEYSVIKVGDELATALEEKGISVVHDREIYDYPSYIGSYGRSLTSAESYLSQYPDVKVVIDLHRDALIEDDGTVYKTVAEVNGGQCAQVMLVVGTNGTGLTHDNWKQNFSLALKLQKNMDEKYPSLARPVSLREERFNQHLSPGALLLELGTNGNTLEEAITAAKYFADSLSEVLLA